MAKCNKNARSFIRDTFSPVVGFLASPDAEETCKKNNLSCVDLFQPFCRLSSEVHIRDSNSLAHVLTDFKVSIKNARTPPVPPIIAHQLLHGDVARKYSDQTDKFVSIKDYDVFYNSTTPWFETYRENMIDLIPPAHHEYLKHFCAAVFVVSSSHASPLDEFARLTVEQQHMQHNARERHHSKWFCADILRYYLIIHDIVEGDEVRADAVYQGLKAKYGAFNCHLLKVNSISPDLESPKINIPDPWSHFLRAKNYASDDDGDDEDPSPMQNNSENSNHLPPGQNSGPVSNNHVSPSSSEHPLYVPPPASKASHRGKHGHCLSTSDHDNIKIFIHELVVRGLIPWAEKQIKSLSDLYQLKRGNKGIFNRWFRNKPSDKISVNKNISYEQDSLEMQMRRLGDLSFMMQMYELAYQMYHNLKRDFESDKAFMYCAGVQEMASMAVLMQGSHTQRQYPTYYMEGALAYFKGSSKSSQFATRAVLLSTEAMKSKSLWQEAAVQFLTFVDEESDLRSALFFEQSAYCYLHKKSPQVRKFSFYLCLAANCFLRANQRRHALRCYKTAMQVYDNKEWHIAENHATFSMGRLSSFLGDTHQAMQFIGSLFTCPDQPTQHHESYVKEYLSLAQMLYEPEANSLPCLMIPQVVENSVELVLGSHEERFSEVDSGKVWEDLEKACIVSSGRSVPHNFSPSVGTFSKSTVNLKGPQAFIGEVITVTILVSNTLSVPLILLNACLLWEHRGTEDDTPTSNGTGTKGVHDAIIKAPTLNSIVLPPNQVFKISFTLLPQRVGFLKLKGLAYELGLGDSYTEGRTLIRGKQDFIVKGPRLNNTAAEKNSVVYGVDNRLNVKLLPPMPELQVGFQYSPSCAFPSEIQCGETKRIRIMLTNKGSIPLKSTKLGVSSPELCFIEGAGEEGVVSRDWGALPSSLSAQILSTDQSSVFDVALRGVSLGPDDKQYFDLWLRGPASCESYSMDFLFYYESDTEGSALHRCSKHRFSLAVKESILVQTAVIPQLNSLPLEMYSYLISLSIRNTSAVNDGDMTEYEITDVLCASPCWELSQVSTTPAIKVNPAETALFCFKASSCGNKALKKCLQLSHNVLGSMSYSAHTPSLNLFTNALKALAPTPQDSPPTKELHLRHFLCVIWKALIINITGEATQIQGQTHVELALPSSVRSERLAASTISTKDSITPASKLVDYILQYPSCVKHSFETRRLCSVPVSVTMTNTTSQPLEVIVAGSNSAIFSQGRPYWTGCCKIKVCLPPGATEKKTLQATFLDYGTYKLDSLTIKAGFSAAKLAAQSSDVQTLITITNDI